MDIIIWAGFILSILSILIISRWHLGLSLITAAFVLAVFTMSPDLFGTLSLETFTNPGIITYLKFPRVLNIDSWLKNNPLPDFCTEHAKYFYL